MTVPAMWTCAVLVVLPQMRKTKTKGALLSTTNSKPGEMRTTTAGM